MTQEPQERAAGERKKGGKSSGRTLIVDGLIKGSVSGKVTSCTHVQEKTPNCLCTDEI